jgi:two-component system NtrC family sensor kinase
VVPLSSGGGSARHRFKDGGVFEDVTDQKEAEQILATSQFELHNVIEMRHSQELQTIGELMGAIAHEINTPVQFVGDNMRFLSDALPKLDDLLKAASQQDSASPDLQYLREELPKALRQAQEGVDRVAKIAKTLKEYSCEQRNHGRKSANLNETVESTLLIARNAMKYVADVETVYGILPLGTCHLGDLQQVLLDLLGRAANAVGEVTAHTKKRGLIRVETKPAGEWVTISISGSGNALFCRSRPEIVRTLFGR